MAALLSAQRSQKIHLFSLDNISVTPDLRDTKLKYNLQHILRTLIYSWELKPLEGKMLLYLSAFPDHTKLWAISRQRVGVDLYILTFHSTRAASTSKVTSSVSLDTILKTAGWSGDSTVRRFYNRPFHKPVNSVWALLIGLQMHVEHFS